MLEKQSKSEMINEHKIIKTPQSLEKKQEMYIFVFILPVEMFIQYMHKKK